MTVYRGLTYRRQTTWTLPGASSDYTAELVVRSRFGASTAAVTLTEGSGITMGGTDGAITVTIRMGGDQTATIAAGQYVATLKITSVTDATEDWGLSWPVEVIDTALEP